MAHLCQELEHEYIVNANDLATAASKYAFDAEVNVTIIAEKSVPSPPQALRTSMADYQSCMLITGKDQIKITRQRRRRP